QEIPATGAAAVEGAALRLGGDRSARINGLGILRAFGLLGDWLLRAIENACHIEVFGEFGKLRIERRGRENRPTRLLDAEVAAFSLHRNIAPDRLRGAQRAALN